MQKGTTWRHTTRKNKKPNKQKKKSKGNYVEKRFIRRARQLQKDEGLEAEMKKWRLLSPLANARIPKTGQLCLEFCAEP